MSLRLLRRFEEGEALPKRQFAIFKGEGGRQWWLTLTIYLNQEAKNKSQPCLEDLIYEIKGPSRRKEALLKLFEHAIDFTKLPFLDNTVTCVILRTHVSNQEPISTSRPIPEALRTPLSPYMDISLDDLECYLGEDAVAVPFTPLEVYHERFPQLPVVPFENIKGIGKKTCGIQTGVFKVSYMDREFIYKEPHWPDDVIAQTNEIESLIRLSESPHVIRLHSLVFSQHPYLTDKTNASLTVVRGIFLSYASQGNLGSHLKNTDIDISWNQRLLWALQIASGLQDIHAANLSHLDIKSNNIVIDDRNNALIIDFGRTGLTYGWSGSGTVRTTPLTVTNCGYLFIRCSFVGDSNEEECEYSDRHRACGVLHYGHV